MGCFDMSLKSVHQLVANQKSPKSGDSLHMSANGSTPDIYK